MFCLLEEQQQLLDKFIRWGLVALVCLWVIVFGFNFLHTGNYPQINTETVRFREITYLGMFGKNEIYRNIINGKYTDWTTLSWIGIHRRWVRINASGDINKDNILFCAQPGDTFYYNNIMTIF